MKRPTNAAAVVALTARAAESGLSFLGMGIQPPLPSWGSMLAEGRDYLSNAWWLATAPGLVIALVVLGANLLGDGLRDLLDPDAPPGRELIRCVMPHK
jgi:peptide/nickel transport system permease protein